MAFTLIKNITSPLSESSISAVKIGANPVALSYHAYNTAKNFIGRKYGLDNIVEEVAADELYLTDKSVRSGRESFKILPGYMLVRGNSSPIDSDGIFEKCPWSSDKDTEVFYKSLSVYLVEEKEYVLAPAGYFTAAQKIKVLEKRPLFTYNILPVEDFKANDMLPYKKKSQEASTACGADIAAILHGVDISGAIKSLRKASDRELVPTLAAIEYARKTPEQIKESMAKKKWKYARNKNEIKEEAAATIDKLVDEIGRIDYIPSSGVEDLGQYPNA